MDGQKGPFLFYTQITGRVRVLPDPQPLSVQILEPIYPTTTTTLPTLQYPLLYLYIYTSIYIYYI